MDLWNTNACSRLETDDSETLRSSRLAQTDDPSLIRSGSQGRDPAYPEETREEGTLSTQQNWWPLACSSMSWGFR